MKTLARSIARRLLGSYAIYRIYAHREPRHSSPEAGDVVLAPLRGVEELARSLDPGLQELADYEGEGAFGFEARVDGELAAACWFWAGERYKTRNFWPLKADEAKLVQIATAEHFRGRGIAPRLIAFSSARMNQGGYRGLYARIWHSNRPSIAAFEKAGWRYIAFVIEASPLGLRSPLRLVRKVRVK